MFRHDDNRRTLFEMESGPFKVCKTLVAKEGCRVGDHYHRNKDEHFLLVTGFMPLLVLGEKKMTNVYAPFEFHVPAGTYHVMELDPGSVLVGTCTELFDKDDEIPGRPS